MRRILFSLVAFSLYAGAAFQEAARPSSWLLFPPPVFFTGLLACLAWFISIPLVWKKDAPRPLRLLAATLALWLPFCAYTAGNYGFTHRQARFDHDRPTLERTITAVQHGTAPTLKDEILLSPELAARVLSATVTGPKGHRQVEFLLSSTFGTWFSYYWREDGTPPQKSHDYTLYPPIPRAPHWFEAECANGH